MKVRKTPRRVFHWWPQSQENHKKTIYAALMVSWAWRRQKFGSFQGPMELRFHEKSVERRRRTNRVGGRPVSSDEKRGRWAKILAKKTGDFTKKRKAKGWKKAKDEFLPKKSVAEVPRPVRKLLWRARRSVTIRRGLIWRNILPRVNVQLWFLKIWAKSERCNL